MMLTSTAKLWSPASQRRAAFAKTAHRAVIGRTHRLRPPDQLMGFEQEMLAKCSLEPVLSDYTRRLFDASLVGAAVCLDGIPDSELQGIALHAKDCPGLPSGINKTLHDVVLRKFGSSASVCLAGSHSEGVAVRCCSDYDVWVHTKPLLVSKAQRSAFRKMLCNALEESGFPVSNFRIGRKAIKLEFSSSTKLQSRLCIDVVCIDMGCDCGYSENTFPHFTKCDTRALALQQASEYVRGSKASQVAICAMKVLCYHEIRGASRCQDSF